MDRTAAIIRRWLPIAAAITIVCGLVYVAIQQAQRQGANDPQIQIAQDTGTSLAQGAALSVNADSPKIDISRSLATFLIFYNEQGEVEATTGLLNNQIPQLPDGVIDYTRQHGEDRITWQPESGIRIAAVIVEYSGTKSGFVLAGRSLREVETRIGQAELLTAGAWIVAMAASLLMVILGEYFFGDHPRI
jgi:hypothetical protein